jgi:replicative DNA helicase
LADIGAIVLHKLLQEKSLDGWSRLKLSFFNASYTSVYSAINKFYSRYNRIPDFEELSIHIRDTVVKQNILALGELDIPEEIDLEVAIDSLINEYTQNEALSEISKFVDHITLMESEEVKDNINAIAVKLDEKTFTNSTLVTVDNINIFELEENTAHTLIALGINNTFDSQLGAYRGELIVFGGRRGHGKTIVCCNIATNQYEQGNVVPYFTIEMQAHEIFQRNISILSGVPAKALRSNKLTNIHTEKVAKVRAQMFVNGEEEYSKFLDHRDRFLLEANLRKNYPLKEAQLVIIHDPVLTIASIDLHLQKIKAKYGDKFKVGIVDYINQIADENSSNDKYDWKTQIRIAGKLKEFATKYDVLLVSAYQIDKDNEARFAKGILDSPDLAYVINANNREDGIMSFHNTKIRAGEPIDFNSPIDWDTLRIFPTDAIMPDRKKKLTKEIKAPGDENDNVPF